MGVLQYESAGIGDLSKDKETDDGDKQGQPAVVEAATGTPGHEGRTQHNPQQEAEEVEAGQYVVDLHGLFDSNRVSRLCKYPNTCQTSQR